MQIKINKYHTRNLNTGEKAKVFYSLDNRIDGRGFQGRCKMRNTLFIGLLYIPLSVVLLGGATGCGAVKRTKWTDPVMRVMIDPYSIDSASYVKIQYALHSTGKWTVVDRADGLRAVKYEQEQLHRNHPDRFSDREKFAHWGKLYGVGGVVTAHKQCTKHFSFFGTKYQKCKLNLAIMSANTAEVLSAASVEAEVDGWNTEPEWIIAADSLTDQFPEYFEKHETEQLEEYKDISKEEAVRQKEERAREIIEREKKKEKRTHKASHPIDQVMEATGKGLGYE